MMKWHHKNMFIPVIGGLVMVSSSLSAQSISWVPAATAVPLSPGALALLAVMFMGGGSYLLFKSQNRAARSMLSLLLLAGMFGFVREAQANGGPIRITIDTARGEADLACGLGYGYRNSIHNDESNIAVKITINPDGCIIDETSCDILQPGEGCMVTLSLPG